MPKTIPLRKGLELTLQRLGEFIGAQPLHLKLPECSQKMRIIMATPSHGGKEIRTYECVYGHRECMSVTLH